VKKAKTKTKEEGEKEEKASRLSRSQVPLGLIALPRSMGARSGAGKHGNIDKITKRAGYGGVFTLAREEHPKVVTAARNHKRAARS